MSDVSTVEDTGDTVPAAPDRARAADGKFAPKADAGAAPAVAADGAPPAAPGGKTIAGGAEVVAPPVPQTWPNDWRELMAKDRAGEDKKAYDKELTRLKQLASPAAVWAKAAELENKFGAGGLVKIPGPKATDEEKSAYLKAIGVPEKPEDYTAKLKLANGRVLGDADKPVFDFFAQRLHPQGATPALMNALTDSWFDWQQAQADQREETDQALLTTSETTLRREWGGNYKSTTAAISTMMADMPPAVRSAIEEGRAGNGNRLGNDPDFLRWLAEEALQRYPAASNHGGEGSSVDELSNLRKKARDTPDSYTKEDEARQVALIEQQNASGRRGRRAA